MTHHNPTPLTVVTPSRAEWAILKLLCQRVGPRPADLSLWRNVVNLAPPSRRARSLLMPNSPIKVVTAYALALFLALGLTTPLFAKVDQAKGESGEFYEDAVKRFTAKDYDGALIQLKNALEQDPKMLAAMALMGETYVAAGKGPAAETALKEAAKAGADPSLTAIPLAKALVIQFKQAELVEQPLPVGLPMLKRVELLELKASAAIELNDRKSLKNILSQIDAIDPNSIPALSIKSTLALQERNFDEAERHLETAMSLAPDSPLVWITRASLNHVRDNHEDALRDYAKVVELDPANVASRLARIGLLLDLNRDAETSADFDYLNTHYPNDPRFKFLKAVRQKRAGDNDAAQATLTELAALIEFIGKEIVHRNLQLLMMAGIANYNLGKSEVARGYLEEYVKQAGGEIETRKMLANLRLQKRNFSGAAKLLLSTIETYGESTELLILLAQAYSGDGQHARATAALERATLLRPGDPMVETKLALSRARKGRVDDAMAELASVFQKGGPGNLAGLPLAILHMQRSEYAPAAEIASQLLRASPDNLTLLNLLGVAQVGLGKLTEARLQFDRALALDDSYTPALLNLGKLDRREGHFAAAEQRFNELLGKNQQDPRAMLELARTYAAKGDRKAALKWAREAVGADPGSFEIAKTLIDLYIADGDIESAKSLAWEQGNKYPNNLFVLQTQADILSATQKKDELRPLLKRMVDTAEFNLDWLLPLAEQQISAGFPNDAQYTLFKAVQERPDSIPARARLAEVEIGLRNFDAAATLATRLTEEYPQYSAGFVLLGDVAAAGDKPADAVAQYQHARQLSGGDRPETVWKHHLALRRAGDQASAEAVLTAWLEEHPRDLWAIGAAGEQAMAEGKFALAKSRFEEFLTLQPDHPSVLNNLANVLALQGDLRAALKTSQRALELAPKNPVFSDTLGWILVKLDRTDEGLRYLRDARTRASTLPEIRYHLAVALQRQGRNGEALTELRDALESGQDFDEKPDAQRLQRELGG